MRHLLLNLPLKFILPLAGAVLAYVICLVLTLKARAAARRSLTRVSELEEKLFTIHQDFNQLSQRLIEQADRIEWLESRAHAKQSEDETDLVTSLAAFSKPSITERRHRVLALARRGLDAETIAATIGAPHGEVELIIELNNAMLGAEV